MADAERSFPDVPNVLLAQASPTARAIEDWRLERRRKSAVARQQAIEARFQREQSDQQRQALNEIREIEVQQSTRAALAESERLRGIELAAQQKRADEQQRAEAKLREERQRVEAIAKAEADRAREVQAELLRKKDDEERQLAQRVEDEKRQAEARGREERRLAEQRQKDEAARQAEEKRLAAQRAEDEKRQAEARVKEERRVAELREKEEAARQAEEKRLAAQRAEDEKRQAEAKVREERRLAELRQKEEAARLAEEKRLAAQRADEDKRQAEMRAREERRLAEQRQKDDAARQVEEKRFAVQRAEDDKRQAEQRQKAEAEAERVRQAELKVQSDLKAAENRIAMAPSQPAMPPPGVAATAQPQNPATSALDGAGAPAPGYSGLVADEINRFTADQRRVARERIERESRSRSNLLDEENLPAETPETMPGNPQIASLPDDKPQQGGASTPRSLSSSDDIKAMQTELKRLGCYNGQTSGRLNSDTSIGLETADRNLNDGSGVLKTMTPEALDVLKKRQDKLCTGAPSCGPGQAKQGTTCIASLPLQQTPQAPRSRARQEDDEPAPRQRLRQRAETAREPAAAPARARPAGPAPAPTAPSGSPRPAINLSM